MIDVGFCPKRVRQRPDWVPAPAVQDICSVSNCVSQPPDGWIQHWLHNDLGWFNRIVDAWSVVPADIQSEYRMFAYRLHPEVFRNGEAFAFSIPDDVRPEAVPGHFKRLGFDAVSKTQPHAQGLECSPLSCNGLAQAIAVNLHCLIDSFSDVLGVAKRFSVEQPEPGEYYAVEVLEP